MEEEQAPPPPEQGNDWGARFSTEIFGYNPYYYGKNSAPIAHPSQITISDSVYLNSPLHWIFDNSQIGGTLTRETDLRDSDRQLLLFLNENRGATPPGNRRNILKRGNKVTRRRDLRPAQPVVRQQEGTSKERNNRKDYRG
jgi:hypothetical protein